MLAETQFVGRKQELHSLEMLLRKKTASLVVIQGRRRIGKSRLIVEFGKRKTFLRFSGLPPHKDTTAQSERNEFSRQLSSQTDIPEVQADDWSKLFVLLAQGVKGKQAVILFDEIYWMGSKDADFLGKLKNAWDLYLNRIAKISVACCRAG